MTWINRILSIFLLAAWDAVEAGKAADKFPRFLDQVPNITKTVGRDALLTCNVEQLKEFKVAWVQVDSQTILTIHKQVVTRNPRISLLHDDHRSWHLQIRSLQENDRGWYMCQLNTDPMRSVEGYLDVVVPPDIIDSESSGDIIVLEGDDITLQCHAKGHPMPSIIWKREDTEKKIMLDTDKAVTEVHGETMVMKKVSRLHMGSYLCIASNNVPPSISKRIHVRVHFPPVTWVPQQLESAYVGQELTIECHTEAYPMSINYWTNKHNEMIVTGGRFDPILAKNSYKVYMKLRIKRITEKDFGTYRCIAKNSLGETDGVIKVFETTPPATFKPRPLDYEDSNAAFINKSDNSSRRNHKKDRNKTPESRNSPNDIIDPAERAKKRNQDSQSANEEELTNHQNYLFDTFSTGCCIYSMDATTMLFLYFIFHLLLSLQN